MQAGWLLSLALACGSDPLEGEPAPVSALEQAIIGGLPAPHPTFNHTGALVYTVRATGATDALCTATLIGPQTVVTAKHCVFHLGDFERAGIDVELVIGPDMNEPLDRVPVVAIATAPGDSGGIAGYGRDVGVAHLDRSVDVTPAVVRPFTRELLGASMVTLGYGVSSAGGLVDGQRRIGRETVYAVEGKAYELLFGDVESVAEALLTGAVTSADVLPTLDAATLAVILERVEGLHLVEDHEAVTGKSPGDTQSCRLDSGGPLARMTPTGAFETYAVVSAGPTLERSVCTHGQVFATFGPITYPFLESAKDWTDPCGDVDAAGVCDGAVARRCATSFATRTRELIETDCAALGQTCSSFASGASCVEAGADGAGEFPASLP